MVVSFILTSILIEATPGPNLTYLAILSLSDGRRAGFAAVVGATFGLLAIGIAAAMGVTAIITNSPLAWQALRWCGVLYMLWLAWEGWSGHEELSPQKGNFPQSRFFWRGFLTNVLNPKAAAFYVAILPSFIDKDSAIWIETIKLTILYVVVATVIHGLIVIMADAARSFLTDARRIIVMRRILSVLLAGVALWFAVSTGRMVTP